MRNGAKGKNPIAGIRQSERRLARLSRIHPEQNARELAVKTDRRLFRTAKICLLLGSGLMAAACLCGTGVRTVAAAGLLGVFSGLLPVIRSDSREKEEAARVLRQERFSYPEIARELAVLLTAGYSVRGAWHRMVTAYEERKRRNGEYRPVFEEMALADRRMREGDTERDALFGFSDRLGIIRYMRLCGLLTAAARGGREDLCEALRLEAEEAERERLEEAQKQGEILTAKLLLPMIALFALILAVLVLPAFLSW